MLSERGGECVVDDILAHLEVALRSFLGKAVAFCIHLAGLALRQAVEWAAVAAAWLEGLAAGIAAAPWWVTAPGALLALGLAAGYLLRQRLYDNVLVYRLPWLRRRGFSRQAFRVRRGAVRETFAAMARPVPLPSRFSGIAVFEAVPDRYLVAFGPASGAAEDVRTYRRDRRAGLAAMGRDLIEHFRANVRLLRADGELRALFAFLDARDPDFAACRPALPGEVVKKAAREETRTALAARGNRPTASADGS